MELGHIPRNRTNLKASSNRNLVNTPTSRAATLWPTTDDPQPCAPRHREPRAPLPPQRTDAHPRSHRSLHRHRRRAPLPPRHNDKRRPPATGHHSHPTIKSHSYRLSSKLQPNTAPSIFLHTLPPTIPESRHPPPPRAPASHLPLPHFFAPPRLRVKPPLSSSSSRLRAFA